MRDHDLQCRRRAAEQRRCSTGRPRVRKAVKPITTDSPFAPVRWHRVGGGVAGDARVEVGVDAHDLRPVDGCACGVEERKCRREVERCQLDRRFELFDREIIATDPLVFKPE